MSKIDFKFIASGDTASYEIVRYRHPDHGKQIVTSFHAPALYRPDGSRRLNYTDEEYQRDVVAVAGYMRFEHSSWKQVPDLEYAREFNRQTRESYEASMAKYPDWQPDEIPQLKGVAQWDLENKGWILTDIEP